MGRFFPRGFVVRKLSGYGRVVWFEVTNAEDILRHQLKMLSAAQAFLFGKPLVSSAQIERVAASSQDPLTALDEFQAYFNQGTRLLKGARQVREFPGLLA